MRDMARKRAKPQKQQCEGHTEVREVEGNRGGHGAWKSPDNKSNNWRDIQMLRQVERDRGLHRIWKSKDNKKTGDAEERR